MTQFVARFYFMFLLLISIAMYVIAWQAIIDKSYRAAMLWCGWAAFSWFLVLSKSFLYLHLRASNRKDV